MKDNGTFRNSKRTVTILDGSIPSKMIVFYLSKSTTAIKTPTIPTIRLILGNSSLFKKPVFLFNSLTSESIGSKLSDIMILLSLIDSIREGRERVIYRFVRRKISMKITPHIWGVIYADPHL
jgi:hypothetical protein